MSAIASHSASTHGRSLLAKSFSTWLMHQFLDAGMTDAEPDAAILVADMRGDRAQAVMSGNAAADLHPQLRRRQFELVVEHGDVAGRELEEIRGLLTAWPESFMNVVGLSSMTRSRSSVPSEVSP